MIHRREFGVKRDRLPLLAVKPAANAMIELVVDIAALKQQRRFTVMKAADGRIQAMSNVAIGTGKYSVQDGIMLHNGKTTEWQSRCDLLSA